MGWGYGTDGNGREVGYSVEAECDHPDCHEKIDRGLAFRCGQLGSETDGDIPGCGGFFCFNHLTYATLYVTPSGTHEQLCLSCAEKWPEPEGEGDMIVKEDGSRFILRNGIEEAAPEWALGGAT